jgi:hypothetical protein
LPGLNIEFVIAVVAMLAGILSIWLMERNASIIEETKSD